MVIVILAQKSKMIFSNYFKKLPFLTSHFFMFELTRSFVSCQPLHIRF